MQVRKLGMIVMMVKGFKCYMNMNNVFFSSVGLSSTEGNFYCNIAKELQEAAAERLNNLKFVDYSIAVIGNDNKQPMVVGNKDLNFIEVDLQLQSSMFAFCAWVREAIKEKERLQNEIDWMNLDSWIKQQGITTLSMPVSPDEPEDIEEQDVINSWDINKRTKYLRLETFAAHYGKLIHPNGAYSKARKDAHIAVNNPITKEGSGRDMVLYYSEPSVSIQDIDSKFLEIQNQYREYEKELNQMKAEIKDTVNEWTRAAYSEYEKLQEEWKVLTKEYQAERLDLSAKFSVWKTNELERISKLKIVIPDSLKDTFKLILETTSK